MADERDERTDVPRRDGSIPTCCARRCSTESTVTKLMIGADCQSSNSATPQLTDVLNARRHPQRPDRLAHRRAVPRAGRARAHGAGAAVRRAGRAARHRTRRRSAALERSATATILDADAVLARIIPSGSLEQIIYRVDALHWIEERGVPVMNSPRAIERSVDKFYTTALLQEAGLPTPETVVCEGADEAMAAVAGDGRRRSSSRSSARWDTGWSASAIPTWRSAWCGRSNSCESSSTCSAPSITAAATCACSSSAVACSAPSSGGRPTASGARTSRAAESARPFDLPPAWEQLALRAAAAVGADYAGVDLLPSRDGTVFVLEVNGIPGWQGLQQATGVDVAGAIVEHLADRVRAAASRPDRRRGAAGMTQTTVQRRLAAAADCRVPRD